MTDRPDWEAKAVETVMRFYGHSREGDCINCINARLLVLDGIRMGLEAARTAMNEASIEVIAGLTDHPEKRLLAACLLNDSIRALLPEEKP